MRRSRRALLLRCRPSVKAHIERMNPCLQASRGRNDAATPPTETNKPVEAPKRTSSAHRAANPSSGGESEQPSLSFASNVARGTHKTISIVFSLLFFLQPPRHQASFLRHAERCFHRNTPQRSQDILGSSGRCLSSSSSSSSRNRSRIRRQRAPTNRDAKSLEPIPAPPDCGRAAATALHPDGATQCKCTRARASQEGRAPPLALSYLLQEWLALIYWSSRMPATHPLRHSRRRRNLHTNAQRNKRRRKASPSNPSLSLIFDLRDQRKHTHTHTHSHTSTTPRMTPRVCVLISGVASF